LRAGIGRNDDVLEAAPAAPSLTTAAWRKRGAVGRIDELGRTFWFAACQGAKSRDPEWEPTTHFSSG
jgi:hypothetical protein